MFLVAMLAGLGGEKLAEVLRGASLAASLDSVLDDEVLIVMVREGSCKIVCINAARAGR